MILFTSPSSVEAFTSCFKIPRDMRVGSIGRFTAEHLVRKGIRPHLLPNGDFERIGEILC
jgi:uroporphyrinogen-III synthase